jgi:hypothetical protein
MFWFIAGALVVGFIAGCIASSYMAREEQKLAGVAKRDVLDFEAHMKAGLDRLKAKL